MIFARAALQHEFLAAFDESLVWEVVHEVMTTAGQVTILGEGAHFCTYAMPQRTKGMALVVKMMKADRSSHGITWQRSWLQAMQALKAVEAPLIPPMRVLVDEEQVVLVMPRGNLVKEPSDETLNTAIDETKQQLEQHGLVLADYWQILAYDNAATAPLSSTKPLIPFICDWSDLQQKTIASGRN